MMDTMPQMKRLNLHALLFTLCVTNTLQMMPANSWADDLSQVPQSIFETRYFKEGDPAVTTSIYLKLLTGNGQGPQN